MKLWVEEYRPRRLKDMVLPKGAKNIVKNFIDDFYSSPHLLLYSMTPGTGKTSLAFVLSNELEADLLRLNASDERGIETIRTKVKDFVSTVSFSGSAKIAFLDEADYLTPEAQASLRAMMEEYSYNAKFIISCNNVDKIIEPIRSRTIMIDFSDISKKSIKNRLLYIIKKEKVKYSDKVLDNIIDVYYPSLRNMINEIQRQFLVYRGVKKKVESFENLLRNTKNAIVNGDDPFTIIKSLDDYIQDYNSFLIKLTELILKDEKLDQDFRMQFLLLAGKYEYRQRIADARLQFIAFLMEVYDETQEAR